MIFVNPLADCLQNFNDEPFGSANYREKAVLILGSELCSLYDLASRKIIVNISNLLANTNNYSHDKLVIVGFAINGLTIKIGESTLLSLDSLVNHLSIEQILLLASAERFKLDNGEDAKFIIFTDSKQEEQLNGLYLAIIEKFKERYNLVILEKEEETKTAEASSSVDTASLPNFWSKLSSYITSFDNG